MKKYSNFMTIRRTLLTKILVRTRKEGAVAAGSRPALTTRGQRELGSCQFQPGVSCTGWEGGSRRPDVSRSHPEPSESAEAPGTGRAPGAALKGYANL
uniref:Uncharacterized protein n=1 Tax=Catharus ustulatus TaxID=91951 RepID=A0A8C3U5F2_CATUS